MALTSPPTAVVLSIAGSDCSGGAGIQADIKTAAAFGAFAATAITAITAQNARQLQAVYALPAEQVDAQITAICQGLPIKAVKLGMLGSVAIAECVVAHLKRLRKVQPQLPIVIDPVMKASSGGVLSHQGLWDYYRQALFPLASLLTPNLLEAAEFLQQPPATTFEAFTAQALALKSQNVSAVLLKGGHFVSQNPHEQQFACDLLVCPQGPYTFSNTRLQVSASHGSGCTLATGIAAGLAQGLSLRQAIAAAKSYIQGALAHSDRLQLAPSNGPIHHFYNLW